MESSEMLATLQLLHAGHLVDMVEILEETGTLDRVIARFERQGRLAAPARLVQFGLATAEDVFRFHARLTGWTSWSCIRKGNASIARTSACKLSMIARIRGTAQPCHIWCIHPLRAFCGALAPPVIVHAERTLWTDPECMLVMTHNLEHRHEEMSF